MVLRSPAGNNNAIAGLAGINRHMNRKIVPFLGIHSRSGSNNLRRRDHSGDRLAKPKSILVKRLSNLKELIDMKYDCRPLPELVPPDLMARAERFPAGLPHPRAGYAGGGENRQGDRRRNRRQGAEIKQEQSTSREAVCSSRLFWRWLPAFCWAWACPLLRLIWFWLFWLRLP